MREELLTMQQLIRSTAFMTPLLTVARICWTTCDNGELMPQPTDLFVQGSITLHYFVEPFRLCPQLCHFSFQRLNVLFRPLTNGPLSLPIICPFPVELLRRQRGYLPSPSARLAPFRRCRFPFIACIHWALMPTLSSDVKKRADCCFPPFPTSCANLPEQHEMAE